MWLNKTLKHFTTFLGMFYFTCNHALNVNVRDGDKVSDRVAKRKEICLVLRLLYYYSPDVSTNADDFSD